MLCEQEEYLKELVAYIHLNPVRAKLVRDIDGLGKYRWCSHGALIGRSKQGFMERDYVLSHFGDTRKQALQKYDVPIRFAPNWLYCHGVDSFPDGSSRISKTVCPGLGVNRIGILYE